MLGATLSSFLPACVHACASLFICPSVTGPKFRLDNNRSHIIGSACIMCISLEACVSKISTPDKVNYLITLLRGGLHLMRVLNFFKEESYSRQFRMKNDLHRKSGCLW